MDKRTQLPAPSRQLGPVLALQALLTEFPDLQPLTWSLAKDGTLSGDAHNTGPDSGGHFGIDLRAVIASYAEVLDGKVSEPFPYEHVGQTIVYQNVRVTWRDVPLQVAVYSDISAYPELNSGLAVAA